MRPADTEVKFCMGKIVFSPNSRKAFIHAAFVSGPGHQRIKSVFNGHQIIVSIRDNHPQHSPLQNSNHRFTFCELRAPFFLVLHGLNIQGPLAKNWRKIMIEFEEK
ncbi:hypothetical protein [Zwartia vadi]|uniref:hypothetical protein n=1 Tax=Zwartia vadi TaxID=3058168 RepID=UPI0025B4645F|nr:hypothetical protein [Zwartia vadi]MDN3987206.1 hypothetical protein [Zwartia vadi]